MSGPFTSAVSLSIALSDSFLYFLKQDNTHVHVSLANFVAQQDFKISKNLSGAKLLAAFQVALDNLNVKIIDGVVDGILAVKDQFPIEFVEVQLIANIVPSMYVHILNSDDKKYFIKFPDNKISVTIPFPRGFEVTEIQGGNQSSSDKQNLAVGLATIGAPAAADKATDSFDPKVNGVLTETSLNSNHVASTYQSTLVLAGAC